MILWRFLLVGLLLVVGSPLARALEHPRSVDGPTLVFDAPEALSPLAARLRASYAGVLTAARQVTGLDEPGAPIRVILAPETSSLARQAPPWVVGYASGEAGVIVLLAERVPSYPYDSPESVFAHELTHILASRAAHGHPLPRWFDEGLAMLAADRWDLEDRTRVTIAMLGGTDFSRHDLNAMFRRDAASARRAYALSAAFLRSMVARWGATLPAQLLRRSSTGQPFDEAFAQVTSMSLDEFESMFWEDRRWWNRWVPLLTSSTVLWMGITFLTLYAARKRRAQAMAIRRRWELEGDGE